METQRANHNASHSVQALSSWGYRYRHESDTATESSQGSLGFKFSINIQLGLDGSHSSNWQSSAAQSFEKACAEAPETWKQHLANQNFAQAGLNKSKSLPHSKKAQQDLSQSHNNTTSSLQRDDISRPRFTRGREPDQMPHNQTRQLRTNNAPQHTTARSSHTRTPTRNGRSPKVSPIPVCET